MYRQVSSGCAMVKARIGRGEFEIELYFSKREMIHLAGFAALAGAFTTPARSQEPQPISPEQAGEIHTEQVFSARATVVENDPLSEASLRSALDRLLATGIISQRDYEFLSSVIDLIYSGEAREELRNSIQTLFESARAELSELAQALGEIVESSLQIAAELNPEDFVRAIAHDVRGAIDGAVAGSPWGRTGILIGAICGAVSSSVIGFSQQ